MVTVKDIDRVLSVVAPQTLSESWDNDGIMLCGNKEGAVKRVLVMLEVSESAVDYAKSNGFDLIVTHHPFIFKPLSRITDDNYRIIKKLMESGISVLSYHTRMDSSENGVNAVAAELLELNNINGFGGESGSLGKIGELENEMTPVEFGMYLKEKFACGNVRASFFKSADRKIKKVAVIGGAGKSFFFEAFLAGADAYVTSEVAHNTFIDSKELDMCIYDCGHYFTENPVCGRFAEIIKENFDDVDVEIYDVGSPYVNI